MTSVSDALEKAHFPPQKIEPFKQKWRDLVYSTTHEKMVNICSVSDLCCTVQLAIFCVASAKSTCCFMRALHLI
jgi:hypothetical protein